MSQVFKFFKIYFISEKTEAENIIFQIILVISREVEM